MSLHDPVYLVFLAALPKFMQGDLHSCETQQVILLCADPNIPLLESISEWGGIFTIHYVHLFSSFFCICNSEHL